jgi:hypothetical protein
VSGHSGSEGPVDEDVGRLRFFVGERHLAAGLQADGKSLAALRRERRHVELAAPARPLLGRRCRFQTGSVKHSVRSAFRQVNHATVWKLRQPWEGAPRRKQYAHAKDGSEIGIVKRVNAFK